MKKDEIYAVTESFCILEHADHQNATHEVAKVILARFDEMKLKAFATFQINVRFDKTHCRLMRKLIMDQTQNNALKSLQIFPRDQKIIVSAFFI